MDSPITTECDALREENEMLAAEIRRLNSEVMSLRKVLAYPEAAVRAVWEHGLIVGYAGHMRPYESYAERVTSIFTEALQKGE